MKLISQTAALASLMFLFIIVLAGCQNSAGRFNSDTRNEICDKLKDPNLCK